MLRVKKRPRKSEAFYNNLMLSARLMAFAGPVGLYASDAVKVILDKEGRDA